MCVCVCVYCMCVCIYTLCMCVYTHTHTHTHTHTLVCVYVCIYTCIHKDWDPDVKLPPPAAAAAASAAGNAPQSAPGGRAAAGKEAARKNAVRKGKEGKEGGKETKKREKPADLFVGDMSKWVEVWSPKVKVTLLPYGVAECSHVRGQLEQCNLEGCHSGREYPRCHKEKPYPKHPIDSDSLLPLPPLPPPRLLADTGRHACGESFEGDEADVRALHRALKRLQRPADCRRARMIVYYHHKSGLASELHKLALALSMALMTNRTLVVAESAGWGYADKGVCGNTTVTCHMHELNSVCSEDSAGEESPEMLMGRCCYMNDSLVTNQQRVMRVNQTSIEQEKCQTTQTTVY